MSNKNTISFLGLFSFLLFTFLFKNYRNRHINQLRVRQ